MFDSRRLRALAEAAAPQQGPPGDPSVGAGAARAEVVLQVDAGGWGERDKYDVVRFGESGAERELFLRGRLVDSAGRAKALTEAAGTKLLQLLAPPTEADVASHFKNLLQYAERKGWEFVFGRLLEQWGTQDRAFWEEITPRILLAVPTKDRKEARSALSEALDAPRSLTRRETREVRLTLELADSKEEKVALRKGDAAEATAVAATAAEASSGEIGTDKS